MAERTLEVSVVTPEGAAFEGTARAVVLEAHDGQVAFLPQHAPFVGELGAGELRIEAEEASHRWYLGGGVVQVLNDVVSVLAEEVEDLAHIDVDAAQMDLEQALAEMHKSDEEFQQHSRKMASARARLRLSSR